MIVLTVCHDLSNLLNLLPFRLVHLDVSTVDAQIQVIPTTMINIIVMYMQVNLWAGASYVYVGS